MMAAIVNSIRNTILLLTFQRQGGNSASAPTRKSEPESNLIEKR
jgi:hypothetical protein